MRVTHNGCMKTAVVKGPSSQLHGKVCSASFCKRPVTQGESVVWREMKNDSYDERLFVTHVACMRVILDDAPEGTVTPRNQTARAAEIRRAVRASGDLFPAV